MPAMPRSVRSHPPVSFDAFLSYRHTDFDRRWAKWLHRELEGYRTPKPLVAERGVPRLLHRVFRDEEELHASAELSPEIERALQASRYLVVICSRDTPESSWVDLEVRRFRELGRSDRILALLVDGSPAESFPRALAQAGIEPLAADVRPRAGETAKRLREDAKLRILAPLLGCRFDDLRRRHLQRKRTVRRVWGSILTATALVIGAAVWIALRESRRADRAEDKVGRVEVELNRTRRETDEERVLRLASEEEEARTAYINTLAAVDDALARQRPDEARRLLESADRARIGPEWEYLRLLASGEGRSLLLDHSASVIDATLSRDGTRVYSTSGRTLREWDVATGTVMRAVELEEPVGPLEWIDDETLCVGCAGGTIHLLSMPDLVVVDSKRIRRPNLIACLRYDPNHGVLCAASVGGIRYLYGFRGEGSVHELHGKGTRLGTYFALDGRFLLEPSHAWDLDFLRSLDPDDRRFAQPGHLEALASDSVLLRGDGAKFDPFLVRDSLQHFEVARRTPRYLCGWSTARFPMGRSSSAKVALFDYGGPELERIWERTFQEPPTAAAVSPDGDFVVVAVPSGSIESHDLSSLLMEPTLLAGHTTGVHRLAFGRDGNQLLSLAGNELRLWPARALRGNDVPSRLLVGEDLCLQLPSASWLEMADERVQGRMPLGWRLVSVRPSRDGGLEIEAHQDTEIMRYITGGPLPELRESVGWNGEPAPGISGSGAGQVSYGRSWTGYGMSQAEADLMHLSGPDWGRGASLAWTMSPSLAYEARVSDRDARVAEDVRETFRFVEIHATDGSEPVVLEEHPAEVLSLAFSPDQSRLFTGDTSGVLRVWDVPRWRLLHAFQLEGPILRILTDRDSGRTVIATPGYLQFLSSPARDRPQPSWPGSSHESRSSDPPRVYAHYAEHASVLGTIARIETFGEARDRGLAALGVQEPVENLRAFEQLQGTARLDHASRGELALVRRAFSGPRANVLIEFAHGDADSPLLWFDMRFEDFAREWPEWPEAIGRRCAARGLSEVVDGVVQLRLLELRQIVLEQAE